MQIDFTDGIWNIPPVNTFGIKKSLFKKKLFISFTFISSYEDMYIDGMSVYSGYFAFWITNDSRGTFCESCKISLFVAAPHSSAVSNDTLNIAIDRRFTS